MLSSVYCRYCIFVIIGCNWEVWWSRNGSCVYLGHPLLTAKGGFNRGRFTFPRARCTYIEFKSTGAALIPSQLENNPAALKQDGCKWFTVSAEEATGFLEFEPLWVTSLCLKARQIWSLLMRFNHHRMMSSSFWGLCSVHGNHSEAKQMLYFVGKYQQLQQEVLAVLLEQ